VARTAHPLTIPTLTIVHKDRFIGNIIANCAAATSAGKRLIHIRLPL
jgi:hypothetical protein